MASFNKRLNATGVRLFALAACVGAISFAGCERKERVLDVKTEHHEVTVDKNLDTGNVEVKSERK